MAEAALPVLLGGAASALGNYFGAQTAANAAKQSAALQQQRFNQAVGYEQPFMQSGARPERRGRHGARARRARGARRRPRAGARRGARPRRPGPGAAPPPAPAPAAAAREAGEATTRPNRPQPTRREATGRVAENPARRRGRRAPRHGRRRAGDARRGACRYGAARPPATRQVDVVIGMHVRLIAGSWRLSERGKYRQTLRAHRQGPRRACEQLQASCVASSLPLGASRFDGGSEDCGVWAGR